MYPKRSSPWSRMLEKTKQKQKQIMTSFSLCHDQTKITKKMEGVVHDNNCHYKTKTRDITKKGTIVAEKKLWHNYSLTQQG